MIHVAAFKLQPTPMHTHTHQREPDPSAPPRLLVRSPADRGQATAVGKLYNAQ